jgi:L-lactate dehydrogenase (cytochrome)
MRRQVAVEYGDTRRLPRWRELGPLFDLRPRWPRRTSALSRCGDVGDVRALAKKRVPRMVFDFVDGAAGSESSLTRARDIFSRVEFEPRALHDVSRIELSVDLLGQSSSLPFFFAPTGATRLMHHSGESGVARVAGELGVPYALSTLATTSVEDLAFNAPESRRWFQLYLMSDRGRGRDMMQRAHESGFETLILAVDTPVPGRRNRDVRNGLVVPPKLTWRSVADIAGHPRWWIDKLTTAPVEFAMIDATSERPAERMAKTFDPTVSVADVDWLRGEWPGNIVVKGVQSVHDARVVAEAGADAVHISTHGGRQLDRAPLPFELLPNVRDVIDSSVQIYVDGGVLSGTDIVACLARGADAVAIGRAYLYGLMAAGPQGVHRIAELLRDEVRTTMALLGCTSIKQLRDVPMNVRLI